MNWKFYDYAECIKCGKIYKMPKYLIRAGNKEIGKLTLEKIWKGLPCMRCYNIYGWKRIEQYEYNMKRFQYIGIPVGSKKIPMHPLVVVALTKMGEWKRIYKK